MKNKTLKAVVIETGEAINVYKLTNGNYHDADSISCNKPPSAIVANKKEFSKSELKIIQTN
jgi:hypothetical protein